MIQKSKGIFNKRFILIALLQVIGGICFSVIYWLYGLPLEAVIYAWFLMGFVSSGVWMYLWILTRRGHQKLSQALAHPNQAVEWMPSIQDNLDAEYQRLILLLQSENQTLRTEKDLAVSELTEYYTLWVHQIKTPIAALDLMLQTEADTEKTRTMQRALFQIEQYAEMALQMIRLDAESSDLHFEAQDLKALVTGSIKKYRGEFIEKRLAVDLSVASSKILTDEKWAAVVLEQVISNALKYTQKGTIRIFTETHMPCTLMIEDTGIGIQPEDLPRVFEKGFTGYNGRMDKRATGIGLYLTKKVCEKLGVGVEIRSILGSGTTVSLTFQPYESVSFKA